MIKTCVGFDIGASALKMVACRGGEIKSLATAQMPNGLLNDGTILSAAALAELIRDSARTARIKRGICALTLPSGVAFFRRTTMPAMTVENLKTNLPYEFRDFITQDREKYVFDYAMVKMEEDEEGKPKSMDLMAAAALKGTVEDYREMFHRAGFKLEAAVPEEIALSNLIRAYEARESVEPGREYAILDLGHTATRLHFYTGTAHEATQNIDYGGQLLDSAIADVRNVDEHTASTYKLSDYEGALTLETCKGIYQNLAIELMQALNFYNYNNPDNKLEHIYICGGGSQIQPLVEAIHEKISLEIHMVGELMPNSPDDTALELYPLAYGAALI